MKAKFAVGLVALAATGALCQPVAGAAGTSPPKPKTELVKIGDDFYSKSALTINVGDTVKFQWNNNNYDSHNVTLKSGPAKIKKADFTSITGSIGIRFAPKFEKAGTYQFHCTIHPVMKLKLTVKP